MKKLTGSVLALIVIAAAMTAGPAFAARKHHKLTYEEAFARCKSELGLSVSAPAHSHTHSYTAGSACMHRYGYRL
jgi:hypothetical protein